MGPGIHHRRGQRPPLAVALAAVAVLAAVLAGCAGSRPGGGPPVVPGYQGRLEPLTGRDFSVLQGRRIVIDPGHGGFFRGALGPNGLTEAEVNLGVALHLRGLLEWAGAEVHLTRTADSDFLSPADSSLAGDLAMRVSLSDSLQPNVFISIHHNSNASLDRTINETQTYYPLNDDGASLDLARAIHRHLVLNLGIRPASIRPGNFHVLRNATVPAVLGEPAMISHPVMAERLSLASSQRLEAEAYFLGLLDYFAAGRPVWAGAATDTVRWGAPGDPAALSWTFLPGGPLGPDPLRTRLTLDGEPTPLRLSPDGRQVGWSLPPALPPRPHVLEIRGHNLADRATPRRRTVLLPRTASRPEIRLVVPDGSGPGAVQWRGLGGAPLPAGRVRLGPELELAIAPDRPDWQLVADLARRWDGRDARFLADAGTDDIACPTTVDRPPAGHRIHLVELDGRPFTPTDGWRSRLGAGAAGPLVVGPDGAPVWLEGAGVQPLLDPAPADPRRARTVAAAADVWPATAPLPGLFGRVIVLDPAGGGTGTDGTGPLGLRGADLNLAVARQAADMLRGAGARVVLTRTDETALLPVEKVRLAVREQADLFLTIGRQDAGRPRLVRYHPGSTAGAAWATAAVRAGALLSAPDGSAPPATLVEESPAYLLRHTPCPALEWRLDAIGTAADELRQGRPGWQRAEARAVLLAIAMISGHPGVTGRLLDLPAVLADIAAAGGPAAADVDWALLDGNLPWSPLPGPVGNRPDSLDSSGGPGLPALLPRHVLEIHAGSFWQVWLLSREPSGWRPELLLGADPAVP